MLKELVEHIVKKLVDKPVYFLVSTVDTTNDTNFCGH
jgi:predicted RNA-binding protein YlqC (UPF0109 family)